MRDILKSVSKLSIPIGLNMASSIIRYKVLSIIVGPVGLGIYSQMINLSSLAYAILPIGSLGLIRYISNYKSVGKQAEIAYLLKSVFKRNLIFSLIATAGMIFFAEDLSNWLFAGASYTNLLILFSLFIPFNLLFNFIDIYLKSIQHISVYVLFMSLNSALTLLISVGFIYYLGIDGAILSLIFSVLSNLVIGFIILKKFGLLPDFKTSVKVENSVIGNIYKVGIVGLISLALQNITFLAVRSMVGSNLGLTDVGIFQCVYSISAGYFGIFFTLMGNYSIPKMSSIESIENVVKELNDTAKFLLLVYVPLISVMFICRSIIIPLMYSGEFINAKDLLVYQLPAELIRAFSWIMGLWLIPRLKINKWITFEIIFYVSFYIISYFLMVYLNAGLKSVSLSYLIAYIIFFIINFLYTVHILKFKFTNYNIKFLAVSIIAVSILFAVSVLNETMGYYILCPVLIGWAFLSINKNDIKQLTKILKLNKSKEFPDEHET